MSKPTTLVTGATGQVGGHVLRSLVAPGHSVRAMTRNPLRLALDPAVQVVAADFDDLPSLRRAVAGVDAAFLVTGGPHGPRRDADFAAVAREAGVRRVVKLSVLGCGTGDDRLIVRWHEEGERALAAAGLESVALRPGAFMSNALRWAPMIAQRGVLYTPYADALSAPIDPADIAEVAVHLLVGVEHADQAYPLSGPQVLSARDQLAVIAHALGREIPLVEVPPQAAQQQMVAAGVPAIMATAILQNMAPGRRAEVLATVAQVTGTAPRPFAEWVQQHLPAFAAPPD